MGNRFLIFGALILLMGVQLRWVETFVLTHKASQFVEDNMKHSGLRTASAYDFDTLLSAGPAPKKSITPPRWLGWAFLSVGAVLLFHGISLKAGDE
jgi:hypothetical protein